MITRKTKVYGFVSVLFFIVMGAVLVSMLQYIEAKGGELVQHSKEIADYKAREQAYNELEQLIVSTKDDRDELATYILTENVTIDFLATIEEIAIEQGIELTTNSLHVEEQEGLFDTLVISFSVDGPQARVYSMLQILETLPYHAFVSGVSFTNDQEAVGTVVQGTIELAVSLLDYD